MMVLRPCAELNEQDDPLPESPPDRAELRDESPTTLLADDYESHHEGSDYIDPPLIPPEYFDELYSGSNLTVCAAYCAIMKYSSNNNLSYAAIEGLIELLKIICPQPNKLPSSWYKFRNFTKIIKYQIKKNLLHQLQ